MLSKSINISIKCGVIKKYSTTNSKNFERCFTAQKEGKIDDRSTFQSDYVSLLLDSKKKKTLKYTNLTDGSA